MTVQEKLQKLLVGNGMFESQASEVMELAIPRLNELAGGYQIEYSAPHDLYGSELYRVWFMSIKPIALKWIDDNKPMAWYRPMFL